jgi:hypothetical protein
MKRSRTARSIAGNPSPARWLFTAFMLLAFVLQSYAVQTHIHEQLSLPLVAKSQVQTGAVDGAQPQKTKPQKPSAPAKDAPDDCPLCQLLYGGQYVAPDALVFFLPLVAVRSIETELGALPQYDAVSHNWRGRAPPQH